MKTTIKHIALGTLVFLLFSQMSFIHEEFIGEYSFLMETDCNAIEPIEESLKLKYFEHKFKVKSDFDILKGNWKVENESVILTYKKRYGRNPDTLEVKRKGNEIESLGMYKKLRTKD